MPSDISHQLSALPGPTFDVQSFELILTDLTDSFFGNCGIAQLVSKGFPSPR
jgi:hypothetical protein